jgi:hypothetical protein
MDRREALKKLGAGSAIAATGSFVLSSSNVAYASSHDTGGLSGLPEVGEPLPITVQTSLSSNGKKGTVTISDNTTPMCGNQLPNRHYCWRINSFNVKGGNGWKQQIKDANDNQVICDFISENFTPPNSTHGTVLLRKANNGGGAKPLDVGDDYSIDMYVTWQCQGSGYVEAIYRFQARFPDPPMVSIIQPMTTH